jgi:hypothetical protein
LFLNTEIRRELAQLSASATEVHEKQTSQRKELLALYSSTGINPVEISTGTGGG